MNLRIKIDNSSQELFDAPPLLFSMKFIFLRNAFELRRSFTGSLIKGESFVKKREQVRGRIFIQFVKVSLRGSTLYDTERITFLSWPPRNRRFR